MARTGKRTTRKTSRRTGCLIWLIPLSLGLIVLAANPSVLREINRLLAGAGSQTKTESTNAGAGRTNAIPAHQEKTPRSELRRLPDTSEIQAIISQDMREQERQILNKLEQKPANQNNLEKPKERTIRLYFAQYDAPKDQLVLVPVMRKIPVNDTPALSALLALVKGPTRTELNSGFRSLIPQGVQIHRLHVESGILVLDVSREFVYNQTLGQEGLILQIYQIANTLTDFPTVAGVRFLVDGKVLPSAGGDGIPMDKIFRHNERPLVNR